MASAKLLPSFTFRRRLSTKSRIAADSVMPSNNRNALSIGTLASTKVQRPFVKSRMSVLEIFFLRPLSEDRLVS